MKTLFFVVALGATTLMGSSARADEIAKPVVREALVTIAPVYDWVRQVIGVHTNQWKLTLLQKSGIDLHSFKPSAQDVAKVARSDFFVYVGGESDEWVEGLLKQKQNPKQCALNLMDYLGSAIKTEELVEGMQREEDEADEDEGAEEEEKDEHIWLSLRLASRSVGEIARQLAMLDPVNATDYQVQAAAYQKRLSELDARYKTLVSQAKRKTILVADRFPFRYLVDDYGLSYYAAFVGCSAESEASFKTIVFLAKKVDALALPSILTLEGSSTKIAETVVRTSSLQAVKILTIDSLQSSLSTDYLTAMEKNLSVLSAALN